MDKAARRLAWAAQRTTSSAVASSSSSFVCRNCKSLWASGAEVRDVGAVASLEALRLRNVVSRRPGMVRSKRSE